MPFNADSNKEIALIQEGKCSKKRLGKLTGSCEKISIVFFAILDIFKAFF